MAIGSLIPRNTFLGGMLAADEISQQRQAEQLRQTIGMASLLQQQREAERQAQMDPLRMQLLQAQVGEAQQQAQGKQAQREFFTPENVARFTNPETGALDMEGLMRGALGAGAINPQSYVQHAQGVQQRREAVEARKQQQLAQLEQRRQELELRMQDRALDRESRERMAAESLALREQIAAGNQALRRDMMQMNQQQPKGRYDQKRGGLVDERTGVFRPAVDERGVPITKPEDLRALTTMDTQLRGTRKLIKSLKKHGGLSKITGPIVGRMNPNVAALSGEMSDALVQVEELQRRLSAEALRAMREASATGGAVGQVTEREWVFLQETIGSLSRAQTTEQFKKTLDRVDKSLERIQTASRSAYEQKYGDVFQPPEDDDDSSGGGATGEWSIKRKP